MKKTFWSVKSFLIIFLAICIIVGSLIISYRGLKHHWDYFQLLNEGSHTWGTVINTGETYNGWDVTGYTIAYKFSDNTPEKGSLSTTYTSEIPYSVWKQIQTGSQIEIVYNPDNPSKNSPIFADVPGLWEQIIPGLICTVIGSGILFSISKVQRKYKNIS